jgi:hypothetical protein
MQYEFQAMDGEVIERSFPMINAPRIGAKVTRGGKEFFRVISRKVGNATAYDHDQYPKVSTTLPQWCDGAEHTDRGRAIIRSRRHQDELCRQHGYIRDYDAERDY